MDDKTILDAISLDNLTWSQEEFTLSDFVDKFPLPQIVKVQEGYYGPDEDSCLGADQILFLHALKYTEKVQARDVRRRELHIPLNCSQKVEIRASNMKAFESVSDLAKVFKSKKIPQFVRVTQGYSNTEDDNLCLNPGDKLKLLEVVRHQNEEYFKVEAQDGSGFQLDIPLTANARFQPLTDGREYYIKEAVDLTRMPFFFQFIKPLNVSDTGEASVFNSALGVLRAEKTYHDSTVVCTTKEGEIRTVVTCPKNLQITITAANGALVGDKEYMRVCRFFHDGVSLKRIENMDCFNVFASRDTIREYHYDVPKIPSSPSETELTSHVPDNVNDDPQHKNNSNEEDNSSSCNKFDYEKFKDSFVDGDDYEDMSDQPVQPNPTTPVLYLETPTPPPLKPKPVVKVQATLHEENSHSESAPECNQQVQSVYSTPPTHNQQPQPVHATQPRQETTITAASTVNQETSNDEKTGPSETAPTKPQDTASDQILEDMSVLEVTQFLEKHRLSDFVEIFEYNQIDGDMLASMDIEMMEALGMNKFQQKKLSKLIQGWRPKC